MFKFILIASFSIAFTTSIIQIDAFPQEEAQPGGGGENGPGQGQDSCAQYQTQCVEGSNMAGQGASSGSAIFPNNPIPVDQVNMTAVQQMPYCETLAQACRNQNATAPGAPAAPAAPTAPEVPAVPATPGGGGFFSSLRSFLHI